MFTLAMFAAVIASLVVMTVAYNSYGASLLATLGLGFVAAVFVGGGMQTGFVPTPEGLGAIAFGVVLGLVVSLSRGRSRADGEAASFPVTPHANGRILAISMPAVVCTDAMYTDRKAA